MAGVYRIDLFRVVAGVLCVGLIADRRRVHIVIFVYISIFAVTADIGCAFTAPHFCAVQK
jgi:hypothetical protein